MAETNAILSSRHFKLAACRGFMDCLPRFFSFAGFATGMWVSLRGCLFLNSIAVSLWVTELSTIELPNF